MDTDTEYLTQQEVADFFRVGASTVSRWRRTGVLPGIKIGGTIRYRREDIAAVRPETGPGGAAENEGAAGEERGRPAPFPSVATTAAARTAS